MAEKSFSAATMLVRIVLVLVLVGLVAGLVVEFKARSQANSFCDKLESVLGKNGVGEMTSAEVEKLAGAPISSVSSGNTAVTKVYKFGGFIRDYLVEVTYVNLEKTEKAEQFQQLPPKSKFGG
jgi:Na+-transporting NADH:ubiquinone oxidoreductase subunit NqrC